MSSLCSSSSAWGEHHRGGLPALLSKTASISCWISAARRNDGSPFMPLSSASTKRRALRLTGGGVRDLLPAVAVDVLAEAAPRASICPPRFRPAARPVPDKRQHEVIGVAGGKAGRRHRDQRAAGEPADHGDAVIGVEAHSRRSHRPRPWERWRDRPRRARSRRPRHRWRSRGCGRRHRRARRSSRACVDSRHSHFSSVRQSPQSLADEPALPVARLDVAQRADLAGLDHGARLLRAPARCGR